MFEQTFIRVHDAGKKPYTVLASLVMQVTAIGGLILLPLIYTQALPPPQLRSFFATPVPIPLEGAKPPTTVRPTVTHSLFRITPITYAPPRVTATVSESQLEPPPDLAAGNGAAQANLPPLLESIPVKPPEPTAPPKAKASVEKRLRVTSMEASQFIRRVQPEYPALAKQTHVQGTVEFTAVIGKTGAIENLRLLRGHPLLVNAARQAILQWRYRPTLLNGEPVEVVTNIVVNFTLNE